MPIWDHRAVSNNQYKVLEIYGFNTAEKKQKERRL